MTPTPVTLAATCPTCHAGIGLPCIGFTPGSFVERAEPHLSRRARAERLDSTTLHRMANDRRNLARRLPDNAESVERRAALRREARALDAARAALQPTLAPATPLATDTSVVQVADGSWEATAVYMNPDGSPLPGTPVATATRPAPVQAAHAARHTLTTLYPGGPA
jgi:hypothetical protein